MTNCQKHGENDQGWVCECPECLGERWDGEEE